MLVVEAGEIGPVMGDPLDDNRGIRIGRFVYIHLAEIDADLLRLRDLGMPADRGMRVGTTNSLNHVHLITGSPGFYSNALAELQGYVDMSPPSPVTDIKLFDWATGTELPRSGERYIMNVASVGIRAKASDRQDPPGSQETGVFKIGYRVIGRDSGSTYDTGEIFNISFGTFGALPDDNPSFVYSRDATGAPFANNFVYLVTNSVDAAGFFDTTGLTPGEYEFRVVAVDIAGNRAEASVLATILSEGCSPQTICGTVVDTETGGFALHGIAVELRDSSGRIVATVLTDSDGRYSFGSLTGYSVDAVGPRGTVSAPTQIVVTPGQPANFTVRFMPADVSITGPSGAFVLFTLVEWIGPPPCVGSGCPVSISGTAPTMLAIRNGTWWLTCYVPPRFDQTSTRQLVFMPQQSLSMQCPP